MGLAIFGLDHSAPAVETAVSAGTMGQYGLATVSAGAPLRCCQMVMRPALVLYPL